tara:strand:- start:12 stop:1097 length:1086 start_codon:yes stop_codon:yes gene_type:complete
MKDKEKIQDDYNLLKQMLKDWEVGGTKSEVTGDLIKIYDDFSRELLQDSIYNNIKSAIRGIAAINGCEVSPIKRTLKKLERKNIPKNELKSFNESFTFVDKNHNERVLPYDISLNDLNKTSFRVCELYGELHGAPPIRDYEISKANYPDYFFKIDGKCYTYNFLYSYIHYVFCSRFIDFSKVDNIFEIGPGAGKQVELIKKIHPDINFYLMDLAPSLYVCHQYLKAIFPTSIVPYDKTRNIEEIKLEGKGQIAFLGNWQLEALRPVGKTMSFTAAVLDLMPTYVMKRYVDKIMEISNYVYMMESREDSTKEAYSMQSSADISDISKLLKNKFSLEGNEPAFYPLRDRDDFGGFEMMFWKTK